LEHGQPIHVRHCFARGQQRHHSVLRDRNAGYHARLNSRLGPSAPTIGEACMSGLMQQTVVEVAAVGELVAIALGNVEFCTEFDVALQFAYDLTDAARLAKRAAGDESRRYRVGGALEDLEGEKVLTRLQLNPPTQRYKKGDLGA